MFFANCITMECVFASGKCILCKLNLRISLVNNFSGANFFVSGLIILVVNHFSGKRLYAVGGGPARCLGSLGSLLRERVTRRTRNE